MNRSHHGDVFQAHLRTPILADTRPHMGPDQLHVGHGVAGHAHLIVSAGEERGKG